MLSYIQFEGNAKLPKRVQEKTHLGLKMKQSLKNRQRYIRHLRWRRK